MVSDKVTCKMERTEWAADRAAGNHPAAADLRAARTEFPDSWASDEDQAERGRAVLRPARSESPRPRPWVERLDQDAAPEPKRATWRARRESRSEAERRAYEDERFLMSRAEIRGIVRVMVVEELQRLDETAREREREADIEKLEESRARRAAEGLARERREPREDLPKKKNKNKGKKEKKQVPKEKKGKSKSELLRELRDEVSRLKKARGTKREPRSRSRSRSRSAASSVPAPSRSSSQSSGSSGS